jgi:DNA polymerase III subunit alpha
MVSAELEDAAKLGACGLLTVELDRKAGEDMPRVTLKRIQLFDELAGSARLRVEVEIADMSALSILAGRLSDARGGRGEVVVRLPIDDGEARVRLGRDFVLDGEVAARIETVPGVISVTLSAVDGPRLALVS